MSKGSEKVKAWRQRMRQRIVESLGGKCVCCGYRDHYEALDAHHIDPRTKDFQMSRVIANPSAWCKVVKELRKCILLCARCHREVHAGHRNIPADCARLNEAFTHYKDTRPETDLEPCPICGGPKPYRYITCSRKCSGQNRSKIPWGDIDLEDLLKTHTYVEIGEMLGISDAAVHKRAKKLKLK